MRIMAGNAAPPFDDAMGIKADPLPERILFVGMTTDAERTAAIGPELKLVLVSMRVMADRAVTGSHWTMHMGALFEFTFVDMAFKTDVIDPAGKNRDSGLALFLLVTTQTVHIGGGAVPPLGLTDQLTVAGETGWGVIRAFP